MSKSKSITIHLDYNGFEVDFNDDGWFNATKAAEKFGKRPIDWLVLPTTEEYISELCRFFNCEKTSLLKTKRGKYGGGTWFHPKLAVPFARWLDVKFSVWCDEQIDNLIRSGWPISRQDVKDGHKFVCAVLEETNRKIGKETEARHYMNESKMMNSVLTGKHSGLNRNSLNEEQLKLLDKIQLEDARMLIRGKTYQKRTLANQVQTATRAV